MTSPTDNPLLADWETPFGAPPFDRIRPEHFRPAFDATMAAQREAVAAIAADPVTKEWWAVCGPMQRPLESRAEGEWWAGMEQVFYLP